MFLRLGEAAGTELEAEVCIIGGGAAGITMARTLGRMGRDVVLAEAGDFDFTGESQDVYRGTVVGDYFDLDTTRLRYFGGTTNHWAGNYAPLQPADFTHSAGEISTAWPIPFDEYERWLTPAREILPFGKIEPNRPVLGGAIERLDHHTSDPVRFGEAFRDELEASETVRVILQANLIDATHENGRIETAMFRDYADGNLSVRARRFVLATGGIENPRLLLHINESLGTGFGAGSDLLGRCFMEHPQGAAGDFLITDERGYDAINFRDENVFQSDERADFFQTASSFYGDRDILSCFFALHRPSNPGGLKGLVADLICVAPNLGERMVRGVGGNINCYGSVGTALEQAPSRENRIELGDDLDRFGMRRPVLHWRLTDLDSQTSRQSVLAFAEALAEGDVARLRLPEWVFDESLPVQLRQPGGHHHIGTTRMAASASEGVVDSNCKVFGTENLYVAGSSAFPSTGYGSPTFPIVAMALRLSDHLASL